MPHLAPLPDVCHVKRSQARDLAEAIVKALQLFNDPKLWLYIRTNGDVMYEIGREVEKPEPFALAGIYTSESTAKEIEEDILAMQREPIA